MPTFATYTGQVSLLGSMTSETNYSSRRNSSGVYTTTSHTTYTVGVIKIGETLLRNVKVEPEFYDLIDIGDDVGLVVKAEGVIAQAEIWRIRNYTKKVEAEFFSWLERNLVSVLFNIPMCGVLLFITVLLVNDSPQESSYIFFYIASVFAPFGTISKIINDRAKLSTAVSELPQIGVLSYSHSEITPPQQITAPASFQPPQETAVHVVVPPPNREDNHVVVTASSQMEETPQNNSILSSQLLRRKKVSVAGIVIVLLGLIVLLLFPEKVGRITSLAELKSTSSEKIFYVTGLDPNGDNWLALRSATDRSAKRLRKLPPNEYLRSSGETNGRWLKVRTMDGVEGWVASEYTACCIDPSSIN